MKIAMIGLKGIPATYGGVERHVEELSARLAARGHDVTVYCRRHYTHSATSHRGASLRVLSSINTKHLDTVSHTMLAVLDSLPKKFDVIHFHSVGPASFAWIPRLLKRSKIVATAHGLDWRRKKWGFIARQCLKAGGWAAGTFPHKTIVVSRAMQKHYAEGGFTTTYIPNGVESPTLAPLNALNRFGVEKEKYILWMGRFVPEKRVEDLIAAFRQTKNDCRLLLAGEIDERDAYTNSVRAAASGDARIIFAGGLYGAERNEALTNAAIVALTSELEGFPIALLEGMRYARPVIASDTPENLEAVTDGINGLVYPVRDVTALKERIERALGHPAEMRALATRAAEDSKQYDWDVIAQKTEQVYLGD